MGAFRSFLLEPVVSLHIISFRLYRSSVTIIRTSLHR